MLHGVEDETDAGSEQQVHGLIEQFGRENAPYEEMIAQDSHQNNVGCRRHRPEQSQTVTAVAHCDGTPAEQNASSDEGTLKSTG